MRITKYAAVGLGSRYRMYAGALAGKYAGNCRLVAVCDSNAGRVRLAIEELKRKHELEVRGYPAEEFESMLRGSGAEAVIVTTKDCFHDEYICRAMECGCDVITEKPLTIDERRLRRILEARKRTGRTCTVTFNYRYSPPRTHVKHLLMSGVIGEVYSVDFHWMLDTSHGADYFRRWHRNKHNSGGLLVHKATHHFDLINWWLGTVPRRVYAVGDRRFYVPATAERMGLKNRAARCLECGESGKCRFNLSLTKSADLKGLYLECEQYDGYQRDMCVFGPDIDIEDNASLVVEYANGVKMAYSLNAYCPWEGYHVVMHGSRGRLEHRCQESSYTSGDGTIPGQLMREGTWTRIYPHWAPGYQEPVWTARGGHGGGDDAILEALFSPNPPEDPYLRRADERAGGWSVLVGIAANCSIAEKRPVAISELVSDLALPDYPRGQS